MKDKDYLEMKGIHKSFAGVSVIKNVDFSARRGEVHGLLGGNGAGKSTFMNILGGIYFKDKGKIFIDGKEVEITNSMQAIEQGISFIHQELKLFSLRPVAENITISNLPIRRPFGFVDDRKKNEIAKKWLDMVGLDVNPNKRLGELSIAEQQMVEIAKALSFEPKIMIFDEPTSSLTHNEVRKLFEVINRLKSEGVCIIYISHKFEEIFEICDRVTVLRNGENAGTVNIKDTNNDELISLVIGKKLEQYFPPVTKPKSDETILEVRNMINRKLKDVSFYLKKGEILGLFGLVGAGRSELARGIFGMDYVHSGEIYISGQKVKINSPQDAIKAGISFLTENRREEGLVLQMDISDNITLPIISELTNLIGHINGKKEKKIAKNSFDSFHIVANGLAQKVRTLSGGNQQKVVLAKWFLTNSNILILDEPTRGVDVGVKAEIYELINKMAQEGLSTIFISSEAPEILGVCHRILVMKDGKITGEFAHEEATQEKLMAKAMGGAVGG